MDLTRVPGRCGVGAVAGDDNGGVRQRQQFGVDGADEGASVSAGQVRTTDGAGGAFTIRGQDGYYDPNGVLIGDEKPPPSGSPGRSDHPWFGKPTFALFTMVQLFTLVIDDEARVAVGRRVRALRDRRRDWRALPARLPRPLRRRGRVPPRQPRRRPEFRSLHLAAHVRRDPVAARQRSALRSASRSSRAPSSSGSSSTARCRDARSRSASRPCAGCSCSSRRRRASRTTSTRSPRR